MGLYKWFIHTNSNALHFLPTIILAYEMLQESVSAVGTVVPTPDSYPQISKEVNEVIYLFLVSHQSDSG